MKKAYILLASLLLLVFVSFFMVSSLTISSYIPRQIRDLRLYVEAQILARDSVELAKFFLAQAKKQGKECLNSTLLNYADATIRIDYLYPLQECENFTLSRTNADANLSKDNLIILNIGVLLNADTAVNEEIFINKKATIYPR